MAGVFIRRCDAQNRHRGRRAHDDGGRDRSEVPTSQGVPGPECILQRPEEARKGPPPEVSEGVRSR